MKTGRESAPLDGEPMVERALVRTSQVFEGVDATTSIRLQTITGAESRLDICDDSLGVVALMKYAPVRKALTEKSKSTGFVRFIADITKENLDLCSQLSEFTELRHLDGIKGNFCVTDKEYYAFAPLTEPTVPALAIYSSSSPIVRQQQYLFDTLWRLSIAFQDKVAEIRDGITPPEIRVMRNPVDIQNLFVELVENAKEEILLLFPSTEAFHREETIGVNDALRDAIGRHLEVRIITPFDPEIERAVQDFEKSSASSANSKGKNFKIRSIRRPRTQGTVTVLVVDRKSSLILEQKDNSRKEFSEAIGLATYSTSKPNVLSHVLFYETLWYESELREKEERSRRESQLLQDILSHDMRNYNQVIQLGTEVMSEEVPETMPELSKVMKSVTDAVHSSTALLERAGKLGKMLASDEIKLAPVDILKSAEAAIQLVTNATVKGGKKIDHKFYLNNMELFPPFKEQEFVQADDLLPEVFANLYSNSVKYTDSSQVKIETRINDSNGESRYVTIDICDSGRGIEDKLKESVFSRYLNTARGTGLGLSIVHALTVQRYKGKLEVKDRVPGDYTQGTTIELKLLKRNL